MSVTNKTPACSLYREGKKIIFNVSKKGLGSVDIDVYGDPYLGANYQVTCFEEEDDFIMTTCEEETWENVLTYMRDVLDVDLGEVAEISVI